MQACCLGACCRRCLYKFQKKPVSALGVRRPGL